MSQVRMQDERMGITLTFPEHLVMKGSLCVCTHCHKTLDLKGHNLTMAAEVAAIFGKHHRKCERRREDFAERI